jgi:hypothetical protein
VGKGITVTATNISLGGTAAGNYALSPTTATANITAKPVTASVTAASKAYDGTTAATITACSLSGVVGTDNVTCSAAGPNTFASANVGKGITVTATNISLGGTAAGNYSLSPTTATATANITAKPVTASVTAASKAYDGTTAATITACSLSGVVGTDNVTCSAAGPNTFASANVGNGITVTATNISLGGTAAGNYQLPTQLAMTTASITPAVTTTKITGAAPNPSVVGQPVTVSYTVTPGSGTIPVTDTVTVADTTGASCAGTVGAGNCSLTPAATAIGTDTLTATYNGEANFSKMASAPISITIVPSLSVTGLSATTLPTQSTSVGVSLTTQVTPQLNGTLTLSCQPDAAGTPANYCDPGTQFAAGGTTLDFTIPAGTTVATLPESGAIQQGTVAGTITVTLTKLVAGSTNVLPQPPPSRTVSVARQAPVITAGSVKITGLSSTGFNVELDAYSTPRDLTNATFKFQSAGGGGAQLTGTTSFTVNLDSVAPSWFSGSSGLQSGGSFHLTVPFTFSGDTSVFGANSVTVTLSNSQGTSSSQTGGV